MDEKVLIYEIKSSAVPNVSKLFSLDKKYFYWNDKGFKKLQIGDYVFVVNAYAHFVLFTRLDATNITTKKSADRTFFNDGGVEYEVSGKYDHFVRLKILKELSTPTDWNWKSIGTNEWVYLNGSGINISTSENRITNINQLKSLSTNLEYQNVLNMSLSNFSIQNSLHPAIAAAVNSPEIQKLLNQEEFYFEKGQKQLSDFEAFQGSKEFFEKVLEDFINSGKTYKDLMLEIDSESETYKLLLSIGKLVSYCDKNAANKNLYNEYEDKRTMALSFVRQSDWVKNLLNYKINQHQLDALAPSIKNAIAYLKDPLTGFTMLSETHREWVSKNLLKKNEHKKEEFTENLLQFFAPYEIKPLNQKNLTRIISNILYHFKDVKELWFEDSNKDVDRHIVMDEEISVAEVDFENEYRAILTAIKTKPFILLAGLSGTGKSRLVRTLAYKTCVERDLRHDHRKPGNFELIPVRPNWHDSTELIGYISRINGEKYVTTSFLKFIAKAWKYPLTPFFLCLDEMNLAPVEQYFAEYLSIIETRANHSGKISSDYLLSIADFENPDLYRQILADLGVSDNLHFTEGISIPDNLIVIGTVNMDETTHSFSRKVLDRAMTFEMNIVDLTLGLDEAKVDWSYPSEFIFFEDVVGKYTAGYEVVNEFEESANVLEYLQKINAVMEGSPFKIAYRVRDEFLIYCYYSSRVSSKPAHWLAIALDEMTSMKILSRIEGDEAKTAEVLRGIKELLNENYKISNAKLEEMQTRLAVSGYTSFWS